MSLRKNLQRKSIHHRNRKWSAAEVKLAAEKYIGTAARKRSSTLCAVELNGPLAIYVRVFHVHYLHIYTHPHTCVFLYFVHSKGSILPRAQCARWFFSVYTCIGTYIALLLQAFSRCGYEVRRCDVLRRLFKGGRDAVVALFEIAFLREAGSFEDCAGNDFRFLR